MFPWPAVPREQRWNCSGLHFTRSALWRMSVVAPLTTVGLCLLTLVQDLALCACRWLEGRVSLVSALMQRAGSEDVSTFLWVVSPRVTIMILPADYERGRWWASHSFQPVQQNHWPPHRRPPCSCGKRRRQGAHVISQVKLFRKPSGCRIEMQWRCNRSITKAPVSSTPFQPSQVSQLAALGSDWGFCPNIKVPTGVPLAHAAPNWVCLPIYLALASTES